MLESAFYSALSSAPGVTALCTSRIYPVLVPEDSPLPAIDYSFVGGSVQGTFDTVGLEKRRVEVNCWGSTYSDAVTLRTAVIAAIGSYNSGGLTVRYLMPHDFMDHDLLQYRAVAEFYVFGSNATQVAVAAPPTPAALGDVMLTFTTAITISQYVAVTTHAGLPIIADPTVPTSAAIGIAANGATAGNSLSVQCTGEITNPGWNWTSGQPIFVGPGGVLTQTAPATGFLQVVGYAVSSTAMLIDVQDLIVFA